jgi:hypothetical protein
MEVSHLVIWPPFFVELLRSLSLPAKLSNSRLGRNDEPLVVKHSPVSPNQNSPPELWGTPAVAESMSNGATLGHG